MDKLITISELLAMTPDELVKKLDARRVYNPFLSRLYNQCKECDLQAYVERECKKLLKAIKRVVKSFRNFDYDDLKSIKFRMFIKERVASSYIPETIKDKYYQLRRMTELFWGPQSSQVIFREQDVLVRLVLPDGVRFYSVDLSKVQLPEPPRELLVKMDRAQQKKEEAERLRLLEEALQRYNQAC